MVYLICRSVLYLVLTELVISGDVTVSLAPVNIDLQSGHSTVAEVCLSQTLTKVATLVFTYDTGQGIFYSDDRRVINPLSNMTLGKGASGCTDVNITGVTPGHVFLGVNTTAEEFTDVVGLSFDHVSYSFTSFICYSLFNSGLFWLKSVQADYFAIHPRGINPVQLNDVIFALHALLVVTVIIIQCCIYDRGTQKISVTCYVIQSLIFLFLFITLFVALAHTITWLTYLYYFSFVKLGVTIIKYTPQVLLIYRNKSTEGFSIPSVSCDFVGGLFSLLQMFVLSYNSDDWGSILGDPTKFGLGLFSMMFDVIFFIQKFCLYNSPPHQDDGTMLVNESEDDT